MDDKLNLLSPKQFPALLREIPDKPKKLYVRGTLPSEDLKWIAVVGSRAISPYGKQVCEFLIEGLRGYPVAIISGLAYGVDALAHKVALSVGLPCIGVPGSGLGWDVLYPRANMGLAKEIVKAGGALLSEFEPDFKATDYSFPHAGRCRLARSYRSSSGDHSASHQRFFRSKHLHLRRSGHGEGNQTVRS
jgi:DNA processing protein